MKTLSGQSGQEIERPPRSLAGREPSARAAWTRFARAMRLTLSGVHGELAVPRRSAPLQGWREPTPTELETRPRMRRSARALRSTLLVSAALAFPFVLLADDKKPIGKQEFLEAFGGPDSTAAGAAVDRLDPDNKDNYELLKKALGEGPTWYLREKAAERLARTGNDKNIKDMLEHLTEKGEKNPLVRQGLATAIAKMKDPKNLPELQKALLDKDRRVRRQVTIDLATTVKDKSSIDALIKAWKDEKDAIVANYMRETLQSVTQQFLGPKPDAWANWWQEHKDGFKFAESDEAQKKANEEAEAEAKKADTSGKTLAEGTTRSRDVDLSFQTRGRGMPIMVIPHDGITTKLFTPFFIEVEKIARVCYMTMPDMKSFKNLETLGESKTPYYPIDKLVEAFEDFRKDQKTEKFVLIACGMDSWVAMRYATKYPEHLAAVVFIAPISSNKGYGEATERMIKQGQALNDIELHHCGLERTFNSKTGESTHDTYHKEKNIPKPEGEDRALSRKHFTLHFGDQQDTLLYDLYPGSRSDASAGAAIPEFKVEDETPVQVPSMVMSGKKSMLTSEEDCQRVAKQYNSLLVTFDNSADFPFVDEPEKFNQSLHKFLVKYVPPLKPESGGDKK